MIAVYVAHFTATSLDVIERWPTEKLMAYFKSASSLQKQLRA